MDRLKLDSAIRALALGLVLAMGTAVAITMAVVAVPSLRALVTPSPESAYVVGDLVDVPPATYSTRSATVLIFARSSCAGCRRAKPLFDEVVRRYAGADDIDVHLVSTGSRWPDELAFARSLGLEDTAVSRRPPGLRLSSVPTLLVVSQAGRILFAKEGIVYSPEVASAVLIALGAVRPAE